MQARKSPGQRSLFTESRSEVVEILIGAFAIYALAGLLFAAVFVAIGINRVDPVAEHAPVGFRLIVIPGVAALWPLLLGRWIRSTRS
jgi:hypothetical protein